MKRQNLQPDEAAQASRAKAVKRHYLSAVEGDQEEGESREGGNLSRIFTFLLLLHVFLIGAVVLYNVIVKKPDISQPTATPPVAVNQAEQTETPVDSSPEARAPAQPVKMVEYVVTPGENLQSIAEAMNVTTEAIKAANNLNAAGDIYVGRKLLIPQGGSSVAPAVVAVSETPPQPVAEVPRARPVTENALEKPAQQRPTAQAQAPKPDAPPSAKPAAAPAKTVEAAKPAAAKPVASATREHEVQSGETFYAIARKYGIGVNELMKANDFTDPGKLRKGTVLKVPAR